jgi:aquaporin Z
MGTSTPADRFRQCVAEVAGTYALVFSGCGAIVINDVSGGAITHVGISLTFGLIVMALIYAIGDISGCHINPAITLGFSVAGRFPWNRAPEYLGSQALGALLAAGSLKLLFPEHASLGATIPAGSWQQSFALEVFLTGLLMFVVLCVATGSREQGIMAGAAVGAVIALEALFAGPICGASMNPARSLAPAVVSGKLSAVWVYLSAPVLGALLAVPLWKLVRPPSA